MIKEVVKNKGSLFSINVINRQLRNSLSSFTILIENGDEFVFLYKFQDKKVILQIQVHFNKLKAFIKPVSSKLLKILSFLYAVAGLFYQQQQWLITAKESCFCGIIYMSPFGAWFMVTEQLHYITNREEIFDFSQKHIM